MEMYPFLLVAAFAGAFVGFVVSTINSLRNNKRVEHISENVAFIASELCQKDEKDIDYLENIEAVKRQISQMVFRLNRIMPADFSRHIEEVTKFKAQQLAAQLRKSVEKEKYRADDLEAWMVALCGGRESMQAKADNGLPAHVKAETRGRLESHLERHQIKMRRNGASGGSKGGKGDAGEPCRSRGHGSQR